MNAADLFLHDGASDAIRSVGGVSAGTRTHQQLRRNVQGLAARLRQSGLRPGERVLILTGSSIETVETLLSVFSIGAVAVPVSRQGGREALESLLADVQPPCCVVDHVPDPAIRDLLLRSCRVFVHLPGAEESGLAPAIRYDSIRGGYGTSGFLAEDCEHLPALIMHSSGSTGRPKAVVYTHRRLRTFLEHDDILFSQLANDAEEVPRSDIVTVLPLCHFGGLAICLYGLMVRRTVHLVRHFVPDRFLRLVEATRCSSVALVPSMFQELLRVPSFSEVDLRSLRYCVLLGEPCSSELAAQIQRKFDATVLSAYGLTECIPGIGHVKRDLLDGKVRHGSVGRLMFGEIRLVGEDGRERTDFGELWVRNDTVEPCYTEVALNASRFSDGWFRTGDLVFRDGDGFFFHRGRVDDMLICNGRNIYPAEVETLLMKHAAVESACVVPVRTRQARTGLGAAVCARAPVAESELLDLASRYGPAWAVPLLIQVVTSLPRTSSGKIDRIETARMLQAAYDSRCTGSA